MDTLFDIQDKPLRESDIEAYLVKRVERAGGIAYKFTSPQRRNVPDRLVLLMSNGFFVELKAPGKEPTSAQLREHLRIENLGFNVYVCDSYDSVDEIVK